MATSSEQVELLLVFVFSVLKVVEAAGIKHVKNTDKYKEALELELKKLRDQGIFKTLLKVMFKCQIIFASDSI